MRALALVLLSCALLVPLGAESQTKVRLAGLSVGAGYAHYTYPYYSPLFWDSWLYHPGFWYGFPFAQEKGEVKLQTTEKNADVYIDGAYAGSAEKLKTLWLDPGAYTLAVQAPGQPSAERRIYVLTGKTLRIKL